LSTDFFWDTNHCPAARRVVLLSGCPDGKKHCLLTLLAAYMEQNGEAIERYSAPLRPNQTIAIFFASSGVLFIDSHFANGISADAELSLDKQRDWAQLCQNSAELACLNEKIYKYERKYRRFFNAAALMQNDFVRLDNARLNTVKLTRCAVRLAAKEFPPPNGRIGLEAQRMLSNMSAGGMAAHFLTIAAMCDRLILIEDFSGAAGAFLLSRLRANALGNGLDTIVCLSPLEHSADRSPQEPVIEFIFIPALKLGAGICNRFHNPYALISALETGCPGKRFEHMRVLRSERFYLKQSEDDIRRRHFLHRAQWELLEEASSALAMREQQLLQLESLYARADSAVNLPMLAANLLNLKHSCTKS